MKPVLCARCGSPRFILTDTEKEDMILVRCIVCNLEFLLKKVSKEK